MNGLIKQKNRINLIKIIKGAVCALIIFITYTSFFTKGLDNYRNEKVFDVQFDITKTQQNFIAEGNYLTNIGLLINSQENLEQHFFIKIFDSNMKCIVNKEIFADDFVTDSWSFIEINIGGFERGEEYSVSISTSESTNISTNVSISFHFVYEYFSMPQILRLFIDITLIAVLLSAVCFTVFIFRKTDMIFKIYEMKNEMIYAVYFTSIFLFLFNPMEVTKIKISDFKREIGAGVISNYDCTKVINNFTIWLLIFFIISALFLYFFNYLKHKKYSDEQNKIWRFLDDFIVLGFVNQILRGITFFNDASSLKSIFYYSSMLIMLVIISMLVYIILKLDKKISAKFLEAFMILILAISIPAAIFSSKKWESGVVLFGIQFVILAVFFVVLKIMKSVEETCCKKEDFFSAIIIGCSLFPCMTSFYIELINVLNQHSIFIGNPRKYYFLLVIMMIIVIFSLTVAVKKRKNLLLNWKKISYPILVFGIAALFGQIPLQMTFDANLFENANTSILISDFLNFGKIPVVEHYGGHMMEGVWQGILYGILNKDYTGAIFSPYLSYITPLIAIAFFYMLKNIWNEDMAFWITLLFPFYYQWNYFGQGMLVAIGLVFYIKKNSYKRALLFWLTCAWCALYRLDLGVAFGIAGVCTITIYLIYNKSKIMIKQVLMTLFGTLLFFAGLWFGICFLKDINPVERMIEFITISLSNQNWGYDGLGNTEYTIFSWCYLFVPMAMCLCLAYTIFSKKMRLKIGDTKWTILLVLGISYFANFSRGLVRHSLKETALTVILWTAYVFFAIFISCLKSQRWILPVFTVFILFNNLLLQQENFTQSSMLDGASSNIGSVVDSWSVNKLEKLTFEAESEKTIWQQLKEEQKVVKRVEWSEALIQRISPLKVVIDNLLEDNETYLDFMNVGFIYSAINRQNPVYVSQSPSQLSGEYAQKMFIEEIEKKKENIPLVLFPADNSNYYGSFMDGIAHVYKYYKVSEYIYENYVPLCKIGEFAIWCKEERLNEMQRKLEGLEYIEAICKSEILFDTNDCVVNTEKENIEITATGEDPNISNLNEYLVLDKYIGGNTKITMFYESTNAGTVQLFYTTLKNEEYSEEKVVVSDIKEKGMMEFVIPITEYTKIRVDIPKGSKVRINSIVLSTEALPIEYGYDRSTTDVTPEIELLEEEKSLHIYNVKELPRIWAEEDTKKGSENELITSLVKNHDVHELKLSKSFNSKNGNYLLLKANYAGEDTVNYSKENDETTEATLRMGIKINGEFVEKYKYNFILSEGTHDYLFRVSSDYYWHKEEITAVKFESNAMINDIEMQILEGD